MTVCPVFAVGLEGKCGTGEQRLQGSADRDRLPAAAIIRERTTDSKTRILADVRFVPKSSPPREVAFLTYTRYTRLIQF
jgi:hypothetical protein